MPALAVEEYRNLRTDRAKEAAGKLRIAVKGAYDHLQFDSLYIPSAEEVVDPLIEGLRSEVQSLESDGRDAAAALTREATRTRPTRDGSGARDAAIWLTVVRHHIGSGEAGVFITLNTSDFSSETNKSEPHPQLLADLGDSAGRFEFSFNPFGFLQKVAPPAAADESRMRQIKEEDDVKSELLRYIDAADVFTYEESGRDFGSEFSIWRVEPEAWSIAHVRSLAAYSVGDDVLDKVKFEAQFEGPESETFVVDATGWIETKDGYSSLLDVESMSRIS